jgi:hypothetical protein
MADEVINNAARVNPESSPERRAQLPSPDWEQEAKHAEAEADADEFAARLQRGSCEQCR